MQKLQKPLRETEKKRKTQPNKRTFDAHQNQYINGVHKNQLKKSKLKIIIAIDSAHTRCRPAAAKRGL